MATVEFPTTTEDFAELAAQGLTVVYEETETIDPPEGDGWQFWSSRVEPGRTVYVWRRIASVEEVRVTE